MGTVEPVGSSRHLRDTGPAAAATAAVTGTPTVQPRRWRQLALLSGLISMDNSEASVVSTLFPALRGSLGLPLSALGVLVAVSKVTGMVTGPLGVMLAQRFRRKNVLVVTAGIWGLWSVAAGFAQNFTELAVLYGIATSGFAAGQALVNGLLADLFDDSTRGRAAGYLYAGVAVMIAVVGPLLGQLSRLHDGWRYGFFASGAVTVLFGLLVAAFFRDPGVGASEARPTGATAATPSVPTAFDRVALRELARNRGLVLLLAQRVMWSQPAMLAYGVEFLVDVRHFSNADASVITAPAMLAYLLGTALGGVVVDRVAHRLPETGRLLSWQASVLGWAVAAFFATQVAWGSTAAYIGLFVVVAALQAVSPSCTRPIVISVVRPELRSAAFSLMLSAEFAGWSVTTLAVGFVGSAFGLRTAMLWVVVGLTLVGGLFLTLLYRPCRRQARALAARTLDLIPVEAP